jgi:opacity protein-like surface antigen
LLSVLFRNSLWLRFLLRRQTLYLLFMASLQVHAQVRPAASKAGDLQVGASFTLATPDYGPNTLRGLGFYATFDFKPHWGIEGDFRQSNDPDSKEGIYERTFEAGPRYYLHFHQFEPYAKVMVGRGIFNFPPDPRHPKDGAAANLAYTMWAGGFGLDYRFKPSINFRADYEFQQWSNFPPHGLTPRVFTLGVAYHFH